MQSLFIDKTFTYDGSQLRSLFAYLEHRTLGNSIVAWRGACNIPFDHMVDGEDLLEEAVIAGHEMLHFIIEVFDRDLFSGVALQRLFASIVKDYIQNRAGSMLSETLLTRSGDDVYWNDKKLSISIATKSPVSTLIHFAMNITNNGTPVPTASLHDFGLEPKKVALELMELFKTEFQSVLIATQKVRPVS